MHIRILDPYGARTLANFTDGDFKGLAFAKELPGGCISADFNVTCEPEKYYPWAAKANRVEIRHGSRLVWSGKVWSVGRSWPGSDCAIPLGCVGWGWVLQKQPTSSALSNERGSTWMTDHLATDAYARLYYAGFDIEVNDYLIPGEIAVEGVEFLADMVAKINEYNGWEWGVDADRRFFFRPARETLAYITDVDNSQGAPVQSLDGYADIVYYRYRDSDGAYQDASLAATDPPHPPPHAMKLSIDGVMTAAQALQYATVALGEAQKSPCSDEITARFLWNASGAEVHPSEAEPGGVVKVRGLLPAMEQAALVSGANEVNTFYVRSTVYNDDDESVSMGPGQVPSKLETMLARLGGS